MIMRRHVGPAGAVLAALVLLAAGCGRGDHAARYDTNLLRNGSFETVGRDGLPEGWTRVLFRGLEGQAEIRISVDDAQAHDGRRSLRFDGDPGTRRFYAVQQEVELPPGTREVHLRGWMQIDGVNREPDQWAQCNFLVTFYDENHQRFQEMRWADRRTRLRIGSRPWFQEDIRLRVPKGSRYAAVACILGMNGTAWFDDVSLTVPKPVPWKTAETKNFVFHWMPGHPFPEGAIETQQHVFDEVCRRLEIQSPIRIQYYLYPDSATIRRQLGLKGVQYVSWTDREIHTIEPVDRHEFIHMITDVYGQPPRAFAEGLVYFLGDNWAGYPVDQVAAYRLRYHQMVPLSQLVNYGEFVRLDRAITIPMAASLTGFLIRRYGPKKYLELVSRINGVNSWQPFANAVEAVYGVSMVDLEGAWKAYLKGVDISGLPAPEDASP